MASSRRRQDIVEAALALLAELPVTELTTRRIAARVGLSQPALFRHFRSREQILLGVVAHVRTQLVSVATGVLGADLPADQKLERLAAALLSHVEANPGLPRLLFSDPPADDPVGRALRQLVTSQVALVTELVREGRQGGRFGTAVDPRDAATLYVGMIQGLVLQWELGGRATPLADRGPALLALFRDGVRGPREARPQEGTTAPTRTETGTGTETQTATRARGIRSLDVRPVLSRGEDPLETILAAVEEVGPAGLLAVIAPFEPRPLLALLRSRGHLVTCEALDGGAWYVEVVVGGGPTILELSDLEPPEPLERVLLAVERLGPGQVVLAHVPRHPRLLLPRLAERGLTTEVHERPDDTAVIRVRRPA